MTKTNTLNDINREAKKIINQEFLNNEYEEMTRERANNNWLCQIDREDKRTFRENKDDIAERKKKLEDMIYNYLLSVE
jgi:fructose-1,6-bisphosphatase/inositol monophosphatase family enzyme